MLSTCERKKVEYTPVKAYAEIRACIADQFGISANADFSVIHMMLLKSEDYPEWINYIHVAIEESLKEPSYNGHIDKLVECVMQRNGRANLHRGYCDTTQKALRIIWHLGVDLR